MRMKALNFKNPLTWFAVGFGSGLSPLAPGTSASFIAGLIFYFVFFPYLENLSLKFISLIYFIFLLSCFFFGLLIYEKIIGKEDDVNIFVWDEFVGMWIACFPLFFLKTLWPWILISFVFFRILDIWKPSFIGHFDRLKGPLGVMMDDVVAGLISALILVTSFYFLQFS